MREERERREKFVGKREKKKGKENMVYFGMKWDLKEEGRGCKYSVVV